MPSVIYKICSFVSRLSLLFFFTQQIFFETRLLAEAKDFSELRLYILVYNVFFTTIQIAIYTNNIPGCTKFISDQDFRLLWVFLISVSISNLTGYKYKQFET